LDSINKTLEFTPRRDSPRGGGLRRVRLINRFEATKCPKVVDKKSADKEQPLDCPAYEPGARGKYVAPLPKSVESGALGLLRGTMSDITRRDNKPSLLKAVLHNVGKYGGSAEEMKMEFSDTVVVRGFRAVSAAEFTGLLDVEVAASRDVERNVPLFLVGAFMGACIVLESSGRYPIEKIRLPINFDYSKHNGTTCKILRAMEFMQRSVSPTALTSSPPDLDETSDYAYLRELAGLCLVTVDPSGVPTPSDDVVSTLLEQKLSYPSLSCDNLIRSGNKLPLKGVKVKSTLSLQFETFGSVFFDAQGPSQETVLSFLSCMASVCERPREDRKTEKYNCLLGLDLSYVDLSGASKSMAGLLRKLIHEDSSCKEIRLVSCNLKANACVSRLFDPKAWQGRKRPLELVDLSLNQDLTNEQFGDEGYTLEKSGFENVNIRNVVLSGLEKPCKHTLRLFLLKKLESIDLSFTPGVVDVIRDARKNIRGTTGSAKDAAVGDGSARVHAFRVAFGAPASSSKGAGLQPRKYLSRLYSLDMSHCAVTNDDLRFVLFDFLASPGVKPVPIRNLFLSHNDISDVRTDTVTKEGISSIPIFLLRQTQTFNYFDLKAVKQKLEENCREGFTRKSEQPVTTKLRPGRSDFRACDRFLQIITERQKHPSKRGSTDLSFDGLFEEFRNVMPVLPETKDAVNLDDLEKISAGRQTLGEYSKLFDLEQKQQPDAPRTVYKVHETYTDSVEDGRTVRFFDLKKLTPKFTGSVSPNTVFWVQIDGVEDLYRNRYALHPGDDPRRLFEDTGLKELSIKPLNVLDISGNTINFTDPNFALMLRYVKHLYVGSYRRIGRGPVLDVAKGGDPSSWGALQKVNASWVVDYSSVGGLGVTLYNLSQNSQKGASHPRPMSDTREGGLVGNLSACRVERCEEDIPKLDLEDSDEPRLKPRNTPLDHVPKEFMVAGKCFRNAVIHSHLEELCIVGYRLDIFELIGLFEQLKKPGHMQISRLSIGEFNLPDTLKAVSRRGGLRFPAEKGEGGFLRDVLANAYDTAQIVQHMPPSSSGARELLEILKKNEKGSLEKILRNDSYKNLVRAAWVIKLLAENVFETLFFNDSLLHLSMDGMNLPWSVQKALAHGLRLNRRLVSFSMVETESIGDAYWEFGDVFRPNSMCNLRAFGIGVSENSHTLNVPFPSNWSPAHRDRDGLLPMNHIALLDGFIQNNKLEVLHLPNLVPAESLLADKRCAVLSRVCTLLVHNTVLRYLDLSGIRVTEKYTDSLVDEVARTTGKSKTDISRQVCEIFSFCTSFKRSNLEVLRLRDCALEYKHLEQLCECVRALRERYMCRLRLLDVSNNPGSHDIGKKLTKDDGFGSNIRAFVDLEGRTRHVTDTFNTASDSRPAPRRTTLTRKIE
jgi:hypothetical protein